MGLEKNSHQPLYRQLMEELKNMIRDGKYKNGDKIPTEPELAEQYGVSRITVRKTIEELCKQGYLVKHQGKGTFVEAPKIYRKIESSSYRSFTETCQVNGKHPSSHVLSFQIQEAEKGQCEFFQLEPGEKLLHIRRVLSADDTPVILEDIYLPSKRFRNFQAAKLENGSLYRMLKEEYNLSVSKNSRSTIDVAIANQEIAENLQILSGEPVIIFCHYMRDSEDTPIYISYETIVGSRYTISI